MATQYREGSFPPEDRMGQVGALHPRGRGRSAASSLLSFMPNSRLFTRSWTLVGARRDQPTPLLHQCLPRGSSSRILRRTARRLPRRRMDGMLVFLKAVLAHAMDHLSKARALLGLYETMKERVADVTRSQYAIPALDWVQQRLVLSPCGRPNLHGPTALGETGRPWRTAGPPGPQRPSGIHPGAPGPPARCRGKGCLPTVTDGRQTRSVATSGTWWPLLCPLGGHFWHYMAVLPAWRSRAKSVWRSHSAFCGRLVIFAVTRVREARSAAILPVTWLPRPL